MKGEILPTAPRHLAQIDRDPYQAAMFTWLQGQAAGTRCSYTTSLRAFLHATEKHPREIEPLDVAQWKEHLKRRALADAPAGGPRWWACAPTICGSRTTR